MSPTYATVIGWFPTARPDVENVALPAASSAAVPTTVTPSRKSTETVGVPAPGATAATVAVNVTDWPAADGFTELLTAEDVAACATVVGNGDDVDATNERSPA